MAGNGGGAHVEPVGGLRGEFVRVRGFHCVDPTCLVERDVLVWTLGFRKETGIGWPGGFCALAELLGFF